MTQTIICAILFVLMLISYVGTKIPMGITSMGILILLTLTGCLTPQQALAGFSNSNTIVIATMFVVSTGFSRTQVVNKLCNAIYKIGKGSFYKMLAGYVIAAVVLCQLITAPTTVFAVIYPLALAMCTYTNVSPSKVMYSIVVAALSTTAVLPIGVGGTIFANLNGLLESYGYGQFQLEFWDMVIGRGPALILVPLLCIFVIPRFAPDKPPMPITGVNVAERKEQAELPKFQETAALVLFLFTVIGLFLSSSIGVPSWVITLTGAILMVATGVLNPREAVSSIPMRIVLMYVGALAMGNAIVGTGLGEIFGNVMVTLLGGIKNQYIMGLIFFLVPFTLTQFMSNASATNIMRGLVIITCMALECNPVGPLLLNEAATTTALFTPMAAGSIPICMGAGGYDVKSLVKMGWLYGLLHTVLTVAWVITLFPLW